MLIDICNRNRPACDELIRNHIQIFSHVGHGQVANHRRIVYSKDRDLLDFFGAIKTFNSESFNLAICSTQILHGCIRNAVGVATVRRQDQCAQIVSRADNSRLKN